MPIHEPSLAPEFQKLTQGSAWVTLYKLDLTAFGGSIFRFCNQTNKDGGSIVFNNQVYIPMPIMVEGWASNSTGTSAKPTLTVSNLTKVLQAAIITQGDMVGARVERIRTFAKFLDDGETPNPAAFLGPDVVFIEQKIMHGRKQVQFQLCSVLDRMGMRIPRRQVLKDESYLGCAFPGVGRTRVG